MRPKNKIFSMVLITALVAVGLAGLFNATTAPKGSYESEIEDTTYAETVSCVGTRASIPISNLNDLQEMNNDLNGSYYLANDIDASATRNWNWNGSAYEGFEPIGNATGYPGSGDWNNAFNGTFDGRGHKITGLHINRPSIECVGLFGAASGNGFVINISLGNVNISGKGYVGGLIGHSDILIEMSCTTGSVYGTDLYVGGLAGATSIKVNNTFSTCSVGGTGSFFGGLIGHPFANVSNSYAAGNVTAGSSSGGLFAQNYGVITSCYWDMETSGQATSDGGTGKTTAEMMQQATYVGWDFTGVWVIDEGNSYPYFGMGMNNPPVAGFGKALDFDGTDDIVDCGDVAALNGINEYTVETWVKFAAFLHYGTVFSKRASDGDRAVMLQGWGGSGNMAVAVNNGYGYTSSPLSADTWYHLAIVYDGTQTGDAYRLKFYVDGVVRPLTFLNSVPASTPLTASRFTMGGEYNGLDPVPPGHTPVTHLNGTLEELRIWTSNLSVDTLQDWKYREVDATHPNFSDLSAYYRFNEGSGAMAMDSSGNGNHGTMINMDPASDRVNSTERPWHIDEDTPLEGGLIGSDADGTSTDGSDWVLEFEIVSQGSKGTATIGTGNKFTYTPKANEYGNDSFTYRCNDSEADSNVYAVYVVINPMNDAPSITTTGEATEVINGTTYRVNYEAIDVDDGDTLTWSLKTNARSWLSINTSTGVLSGMPAYTDNGTYWVKVTVTDTNCSGDSRNFSLTVMGDFDGDGTADHLDEDDDDDGLPDTFETSNALDPRNSSDVGEDPDGDGLTNLEEYLNDTRPNDNDTDDDGMPDGWEVKYSLNSTQDDSEDDPDGDGYSNLVEFREGTDPRNPDSHPISKKAGKEKIGTLWWIYIIIFIVVLIVILLVLLSRRKKKEEPEPDALEEEGIGDEEPGEEGAEADEGEEIEEEKILDEEPGEEGTKAGEEEEFAEEEEPEVPEGSEDIGKGIEDGEEKEPEGVEEMAEKSEDEDEPLDELEEDDEFEDEEL